ncbi:MAG TPA: hypothetical protein VK054_09310 [Beutenbergiaceae bacterium]|nr:hypothetical protein [Beutenbergiaceae bacterium]
MAEPTVLIPYAPTNLNLTTWVPATHHKPTAKHAQHNTPALTL